jgi:DNA-binding transcriptional LysR family regulator
VKDFMTSRRLLELDKGVVLAPEGTFQNESDDITGIPLADYEEKICLGLCYRRENRNPLLLELLGYLKNE